MSGAIEVLAGDIMALDVDAIVNAANETLLGGWAVHAFPAVERVILVGYDGASAGCLQAALEERT